MVRVSALLAFLCAAFSTLAAKSAGAAARACVEPALDDRELATEHELPVEDWAASLEPIFLKNLNTGLEGTIRLYGVDGTIDEEALLEFERLLSVDGQLHEMSPRLAQLVVKTVYHFNRPTLISISQYRPNASRHTTGEALDFQLEGIKPPVIAAYMQTFARAGVGFYTHSRTQFVHLDVREESFHWVDGSPPGVHWREQPIPDPWQKKRDEAWRPEMDLPIPMAK